MQSFVLVPAVLRGHVQTRASQSSFSSRLSKHAGQKLSSKNVSERKTFLGRELRCFEADVRHSLSFSVTAEMSDTAIEAAKPAEDAAVIQADTSAASGVTLPAPVLNPLFYHEQNLQGQPAQRLAFVWNGEAGAYSEAAVRRAYPDHEAFEVLPLESFETVFEAVEAGVANYAIVPVENSLTGSIHGVYDLLFRQHQELYIVGEIQYLTKWCLGCLPGVNTDDIHTVIGHPKALAQCTKYLNSLGLKSRPTSFTTGTARSLRKDKATKFAAVVSPGAVKQYELELLADGIEDRVSVTRFVILSRTPADPDSTVPSKTSLVFSLPDKTGSLFKTLSVFALRDIDLTKIDSRPSDKAGSSMFYLDLAASINEDRCRNAMRHLEEIADWVKVLGSYPRDLEPKA